MSELQYLKPTALFPRACVVDGAPKLATKHETHVTAATCDMQSKTSRLRAQGVPKPSVHAVHESTSRAPYPLVPFRAMSSGLSSATVLTTIISNYDKNLLERLAACT